MRKLFAKKSLGQNFLKCGWALQSMVKTADLKKEDVILEIGPGKGILTLSLLEKSGLVIAVEKDDRLIPHLEQKFEHTIKAGQLMLVHGDILEQKTIEKIFDILAVYPRYKLIANIPYYITGQLIENFLSAKFQPEKMVLMLQKEVVKRIVATDKKESILSIAVKVYGVPKNITDVPRSCFSPSPNVDSAILEISNVSKSFFENVNEKEFFIFLKTGFAHKRKIVSGNLREKYEKTAIEAAFGSVGIDLSARAENISAENWKKLAVILD